ncbi:DUF6759 domain-containing protein [Kaistella sp.]|uniref:DUF6759 domain-containing protein n=1 Tax=Kaistella sp. TaxID=2782235 RepID=UPI002F943BB6
MKNLKKLYLLVLGFLMIQCDVVPNSGYRTNNPGSADESKEFADLMEKDQTDKNKKTAEVLTYLLNDTDPADPYTVAVIDNLSGCNIIVRLVAVKGNQIYNLPVPKNSKNHFKIAKGSYTMRSNVCKSKYYSQKSINEPLILKLSAH